MNAFSVIKYTRFLVLRNNFKLRYQQTIDDQLSVSLWSFRCSLSSIFDNRLVLILVCPQTEHTVYTDAFFENQNIVINALDNLEARRYMDR